MHHGFRRKILLQKGRLRFGLTDAATESAIQAIDDLDRLERMTEAILTVNNWQELLATE